MAAKPEEIAAVSTVPPPDEVNADSYEDFVEDSSRMSESQYQSEQLYFRNLLPEEMWMKILDSVTETDDLINFVNSSPYLWELKRKKRAVFLFPKIMELLAVINYPRDYVYLDSEDKKDEEDEDGNMGGADNDDQDANNEVRDNTAVWRQTVLNCRLVCSTWNKAVENIYQRPLMTGINEYVKPNMDPTSFENTKSTERSKWKLRNRSREDIQQALEQFEGSHASGVHVAPKCPTLTRYLIFRFEEPNNEEEIDELQEYLKAVTRFVSLFGHHVWYLHVEMFIRNGFFRCELLYLKIREWLGLMPNLKFLRIIGPQNDNNDPADFPGDFFQRNPLAKLTKLEVLLLRFTAGPIATELIRSTGDKLAHLTMSDMDSVDAESVSDALGNLQSLASMRATLSGDEDIIVERIFDRWKHLTTLKVRTSGEPFQNTFQNLESYLADTLIDLCLDFSHDTLLEESKVLRLKLPKLRRLKLDVSNCCCLLDFALPLADNLERLEIIWSQWVVERRWNKEERDKAIKEQIIQFCGFEEKMEESNIWNLFGKLQTIKVSDRYFREPKFTVYTRKEKKQIFEEQRSRFDREEYLVFLAGF